MLTQLMEKFKFVMFQLSTDQQLVQRPHDNGKLQQMKTIPSGLAVNS